MRPLTLIGLGLTAFAASGVLLYITNKTDNYSTTVPMKTAVHEEVDEESVGEGDAVAVQTTGDEMPTNIYQFEVPDSLHSALINPQTVTLDQPSTGRFMEEIEPILVDEKVPLRTSSTRDNPPVVFGIQRITDGATTPSRRVLYLLKKDSDKAVVAEVQSDEPLTAVQETELATALYRQFPNQASTLVAVAQETTPALDQALTPAQMMDEQQSDTALEQQDQGTASPQLSVATTPEEIMDPKPQSQVVPTEDQISEEMTAENKPENGEPISDTQTAPTPETEVTVAPEIPQESVVPVRDPVVVSMANSDPAKNIQPEPQVQIPTDSASDVLINDSEQVPVVPVSQAVTTQPEQETMNTVESAQSVSGAEQESAQPQEQVPVEPVMQEEMNNTDQVSAEPEPVQIEQPVTDPMPVEVTTTPVVTSVDEDHQLVNSGLSTVTLICLTLLSLTTALALTARRRLLNI